MMLYVLEGFVLLRVFNIIKYMRGEHKMNISLEKYVRILMLSRLANGDELLPTYEPSEDDIMDLCSIYPVINEYGKCLHDIDRRIIN